MKLCKRCKEEKEPADFYKPTTHICKKCKIKQSCADQYIRYHGIKPLQDNAFLRGQRDERIKI